MSDGEYGVDESNGSVAIMPDVSSLPHELPTDIEALRELRNTLIAMTDRPRGAGVLIKSIDQLLYRQPKVDAAQKAIKRSWGFVHGQRSSAHAVGQKRRSIESRAQKFYESLSTPALRTHCALHGVPFDSMGSIEEAIQALVDKNIALVG